MAKSHVMNYWEKKLREEASLLPSLEYFSPYFHSLARPHPLLSTPGSNPHKVAKAVVQCRMKSGRYRTSLLAKHWSPSNPNGNCQAPTCNGTPESLEHLLIHCPYYTELRESLRRLWIQPYPIMAVQALLLSVLEGPPKQFLHFILDPSSHPQTIHLCQVHGQDLLKTFYHLTRTWCYSIHKQRLKLLKQWKHC